MSGKTYLQEADEKLKDSLNMLFKGVTLHELAEVLGSEATARRQLKRLEDDIYQVDVSCTKGVYKIESISDDNIWRSIFKALK